jgi:hypothetical protein
MKVFNYKENKNKNFKLPFTRILQTKIAKEKNKENIEYLENSNIFTGVGAQILTFGQIFNLNVTCIISLESNSNLEVETLIGFENFISKFHFLQNELKYDFVTLDDFNKFQKNYNSLYL